MKTFISLAVTLLATAVASLTPSPALAYRGDRVAKAQERILGTCLHNRKSKVLTCIVGTFRYKRLAHGHRIWVRGIRVSIQRCWSGECHGHVKEANLWSPHQIGRAPRSAAEGPPDGAVSDVCLGVNRYCGAPWNWLTHSVDKRIQALDDDIAKPCVLGTIGGYGVKVAEATAGQAMAESATLATAERGAWILGPPGFAVAALGGCFLGIGAHGWSSVRRIASAFNPFDRTGVKRRAPGY